MLPTPDLALQPVRALLGALDDTLENIIVAHGFSFTTLAADDAGAVLRFDSADAGAGAGWQLCLTLPRQGLAALTLRRGDDVQPSAALTLLVDGRPLPDLATALAVGFDLVAALAP